MNDAQADRFIERMSDFLLGVILTLCITVEGMIASVALATIILFLVGFGAGLCAKHTKKPDLHRIWWLSHPVETGLFLGISARKWLCST